MTSPYVWPTDQVVLAKLDWWRDQKFGVIIHWGPYSRLGVVESWTLCQEGEDFMARPEPWQGDPDGYREFYEKLPEGFDAPAFEPERWAEACAAAGMRYVVFTTKHHDGFAMYDTRLSDYKSTTTPLGRDVAAEVFDAFRAHGLGVGVYFSKADWHHPDYWTPGLPTPDRHANHADPGRWRRFTDFTHGQIEELLTGYGPVDVLWLDAGWVKPPREDLDLPRLAARARELQPGLLVVDREVHGPQEDYRTPEQTVPVELQPFPWESCITLGPSWYTAGPGETYKTAGEIVRLLCRIVARGGNLLLGLGPDHTGALPDTIYERLAEIGAWLGTHGEAIYGTRPCEPYETDDLVFTRRADTIYAIGLRVDLDEVRVPLPQPPQAVRLLGHDGPLDWQTDDGEVIVRLPGSHRARHAFALSLTMPPAPNP
ncbi:alpha-L-fucosidase [Nonomuraea africana]|uniref:alpha-L-fucosidase n=1 Tax=Nonomuraea africana TaxID=46171 RepID=A0ABR9KAP0_9ACTN|nr:alpha-L-fucosidase [Nonomuraea africana]MBE1558970.1 alpha-L-fucosidase [Nonomuraea africana]